MFYSLEEMKKGYDAFEKKDIRVNFEDFQEHYSLTKLEQCEGTELVKRIFGDKHTNPKGLFYWIEYGKQPTTCNCGVGRQIGVQYKGETSEIFRYTKDSDKSEVVPISESEAIKLAKSVRAALKNSCEIIHNESLEDPKDYERVYTAICDELKTIDCPDSSKWYWSEDGTPSVFLLKYYLCTFPEKFAATYAPVSQDKVLTKILPKDEISKIPFVKNGQISIYAREIGADCINFEYFITDKGFYSQSQNRIWKISHSPDLISRETLETLRKRQVITMSATTKALGRSKTTQGQIFMNEIKCGDLFYLCYGNSLQLIGKITSEKPRYNEEKGGDWNEYFYETICESINDNAYVGPKKWWTPNNNSTLKLIEGEELKQFEELILLPFFGKQLSDLFDGIDQYTEVEVNMMTKNGSEIKLNTILYGPPGTGKTYNTAIFAVAICDSKKVTLKELENQAKTTEGYERIYQRFQELVNEGRIVFTTFHQSFGYEDFIEGIKPFIGKNSDVIYKVEPGIFKGFCDAEGDFADFDTAWKNFIADVEKNDNKTQIPLVTKERNLKWDAEHERFSVADYASPYQYIDKELVEKESCGDNVWNENSGSQNTQRYTCHGIIKKLREEYRLAPSTAELSDENKVFIIDEINRGNISKIFGELITLIEEEKRGTSYAILPYSGERFTVPRNVYILGTMNTADRSLALMDTALRRRFDFIEMMPNSDLFEGIVVEGISIRELLDIMNKRIEYLYDREHTIGHAYFKELLKEENQNIDTVREIFKKKIIPLLQEYFYDDYEKIGMVLGDRKQLGNSCFVREEEMPTDLFRDGYNTEIEAKKYSIHFEKIDHFNAERFIAIYQA